MRTHAAIIIALAAAGCWSAPPPAGAPRSVDGPVAGTRWITPLDSWRTNGSITTVLVLGPTALLGGSGGRLTELDLGSGRVVRETSLGTMMINELVRLRDGRILALGIADKRSVGAVIEPRTLEPTPVDFGGAAAEATFLGLHARVMPDGGLLLAGPGLPLAIFDPATWTQRQVIASDLGWTDPFVTGDAIYAKRAYSTAKFDLRGQRDAKFGKLVAGAAGDTVVTRELVGNKLHGFAVTAGGARIDLGEVSYGARLDPEGRRIADVIGRTLTVRSLVDGHVLGSFDLGPRAATSVRVAFAGDRLVIGDGTLVRVIDLASGYITPRGPAPVDVDQLLVGDDGTVVVAGAERMRFQGGKRTRVEVLAGAVLTNPADELTRYAIRQPLYASDRGPTSITVIHPGHEKRVYSLSRAAEEGWLGTNGEVAAVLEWDSDDPQKLVRSQGDELVDVFTFNLDALVSDVDVDAGVAAVSIKGTTHLVDLETGSATGVTLRAPNCAEYATVALERGGHRAVTLDEGALVLWDRRRGEPIASLAFSEELYVPSFVRAHGELLVQFHGGFVLWSPQQRELRVARVPHLQLAEVSPDGRVLAITLHDGRVAVADYATMRASLPVQRAKAAPAVPPACDDADPFKLDEEDTESYDGYDGSEPWDEDEEQDP